MANPLVLAMNEIAGPKRSEIPVPRFFTFKMSEIPGGVGLKPGNAFTVRVSGVVKSINDEQEIFANITNVEGNPPLTVPKEVSEIIVRSDESHSP